MPGTLTIRWDGANFYVLDTTGSGTTTYGPYTTRADAEAQLASLQAAATPVPDVDVGGTLATGFVEFDELAGNPSAPAADVLRLFAKDVSGRTVLHTRVADGSVRRIYDDSQTLVEIPSIANFVFGVTSPGNFRAGFEASGGSLGSSGLGTSFGFATGAASLLDPTARGSLVFGYAKAGARLRAIAAGSFVGGYGINSNALSRAFNKGSFVFGYNYNGSLDATHLGAFVQGNAGDAGTISASNQGAHASGYCWNPGSTISVSGTGGFAHGRARNGGDILASGASVAFGHANTGTISAGAGGYAGAFAVGYARISANARVEAPHYGAFAHGYAYGAAGATLARVEATQRGSFAGGWVSAASGQTTRIRASGRGSVAHGYSKGAGGDVTASNFGSIALGYANAVALTASGRGAFAGGYAKTNAITASAAGSHAFGDSTTGAIVASAANAMQFGPGTNSIANSLQVGTAGSGIHLHGGGAPGAPANGDIWNTGTLVTIRSDGVNIILDQQTGVAVTAAAIHAALVNMGLITA